jgi:opacity protein-like surface antigen/outer membrane protein OmpA-like peptidoglycan-associated protein
MRLSKRFIAIAVFGALLIPAFMVRAQDSRGTNDGTPKMELFVGYSYLRAVPAPSDGNRLVWLNGGSTSLAYNFTRHLGLVGDFGGFADSQLLLAGTGITPKSSGSVYTYLFGPRISFRNNQRFTPFVQALFGGIHASDVTLASGCMGVGCTPLPAENSFSWTGGGGLDINLRRHLAIRLIQAEYLMTKFQNYSTGTASSQNDMRLSSGIVFRFGGYAAPPLPLTLSCSATPASVFPGDPVTVTATAGGLNPKLNAVYTWSGAGVSGTGTTATVATGALAPGSYTVKCGVKEGKPGKEGLKPWESAEATASFNVKAFEPPTISCSAAPSTIKPGETSAITASGVSPQNRPLTYTYSATAGSVSGTGSSATYSSTGAPTGAVGITCTVSDDKGQTATANTGVTISAPYVPPVPHTQALCSISFATDKKRPERVDNEAKACLDEVALELQKQSDARAVVVGNSDAKEKTKLAKDQKLALKNKHLKVTDPAAERAVNAKDYLVTEKGIDGSRISAATGTVDGQTAQDYLVPSGASFTADVTGTTPVDETAVKAQPRKPLPTRAAHKPTPVKSVKPPQPASTNK